MVLRNQLLPCYFPWFQTGQEDSAKCIMTFYCAFLGFIGMEKAESCLRHGGDTYQPR